MGTLLFPLTHGALWYVGIDGAGVDHETERLLERIARLDAEPNRSYRRRRDGYYPKHLRALHPDLLPGRTDLGIHRHSEVG